MRRYPWSREQVRLIYELAASGYGLQEMADEVGATRWALAKKLRRLNLRLRSWGMGRYRAEKRAMLVGLVQRGCATGPQLAPRLGVSAHEANRLAAELVRAGVLRRTGYGRWSRLMVVGRAWSLPDDAA